MPTKLVRAAFVCCHGTKCPLLTAFFGPSVLPAPAEQTKVATVLGTFFHFLVLGPPLFKTTEGVVVLFQIFAWAPY